MRNRRRNTALDPATHLAHTLREAIETGIYLPGQRLPGAGLLGVQYKVSQDTARRALKMLCDQGILTVCANIGHFVATEEGQPLLRDTSRTTQILDDLRSKITSEADGYTPGKQLPGLNHLARTYNVSTQPVRRAISQLVSENLLVVISGDGTYVSIPKDAAE